VERVEIPVNSLSTSEIYSLMIDLVAPRPIAWVSTQDSEGRRNLAPFSYYQAVCSAPPMIALALAWRADGTMKDTLANILDTREFTVNHVSRELAEAMSLTSAELAHDRSEWEEFSIEAQPAVAVAPDRVRGALAGLECRLSHAIALGVTAKGKPSSTLVLAEVVHFFAATELIERKENGKIAAIDPAKLRSVGRLGGSYYAETGDRFELVRGRAKELS
jgi:flavin reductase (DIM6/NTAB) family NADH-FMN oxidoreductase RutF